MKIKSLLRLELMNLFNINETKFTKDKKVKTRNNIFLGAFAYIGIVIIGYIIAYLSFFKKNNATNFIMPMSYLMAFVLVIVISLVNMGELFRPSFYESQIVLPVKKSDIVIAKILSVYLFGLIASFVTVFLGTIFYITSVNVTIMFYPMVLIGIFFIPLFPIAVSAIINFVFSFIFSKFHLGNLAKITIILIAVVLFVIGYYYFMRFAIKAENFDINSIISLLSGILNKLSVIIITMSPFTKALINNDLLNYFIFILLNILPIMIVIAVIIWQYNGICQAMTNVKTKRDFRLNKEKKSTIIFSLYKKELMRFTSSVTYATNTLIGYILSIISSVFLLIKSDFVSKIPPVYLPFIPIILAMMYCLVTTTMCSISIEGKNFWIIKTLPIKISDYIDSKILFYMSFVGISHTINTICLGFALKVSLLNLIVLFVLPIIIAIFIGVLTLFLNTKFYNLNYKSDAEVVKQGSSIFLGMLSTMLTMFVISGLCYIFNNYIALVMVFVSIVLIAVSIIIYKVLLKLDLKSIE